MALRSSETYFSFHKSAGRDIWIEANPSQYRYQSFMSRDAVSVAASADIATGKADAEYQLHMEETLCNELSAWVNIYLWKYMCLNW
jgi:diphthamide synthase (EF-2-diphthine--ammonia ligase)